jgi:hypothetical protein
MTQLYRIEELFTTGWEVTDSKMSKEDCKKKLEGLLADGISPDRLRVVAEHD